MSAKSPEEEAGYGRFTAILPSETIKKIDLLKAIAGYDNRNKVISDAITFMDYVCKKIALTTVKANETRTQLGTNIINRKLELAMQEIQDTIRLNLEDYWANYALIFKNAQENKKN